MSPFGRASVAISPVSPSFWWLPREVCCSPRGQVEADPALGGALACQASEVLLVSAGASLTGLDSARAATPHDEGHAEVQRGAVEKRHSALGPRVQRGNRLGRVIVTIGSGRHGTDETGIHDRHSLRTCDGQPAPACAVVNGGPQRAAEGERKLIAR